MAAVRRGPREPSLDEARVLLASRLRERRGEVEAAIATRVYAIADPREVRDPSYESDLQAAVRAAVEHRLEGLEMGERRAPEVPAVLLAQARLDARDGVELDTVLRRYFAGNALFGDFLGEEAERLEVPSSTLRRLLAAQATVFDRMVAAVSAEHGREARNRPSGTAERRRQCVKRLLAGELVEDSVLDYDLDAHHLAAIARGEEGERVLSEVAAALGRRLLIVRREEEPVWAAWLGGGRPLAVEEALAALGGIDSDGVVLALGEPDAGLAGWRSSHLQAKAALPIAERRGIGAVRFLDVALLAAVERDELVAASLRRLYLEPLAGSRDGGAAARETLRAYFGAERNISSTAATLGVDRRTVRNRLRAVEQLLGRPLREVAVDLEVALRLDC